MTYITSELLEPTGYVIVDGYNQAKDHQEWLDVEYVDWKSSGDSRFAPLASAYGEMECNGFWNHTPPKTDKDGVWVAKNVAAAPLLTARAREVRANIGRCRIIELQPNTYAEAIYNLHRDDNNRLNPEGTGWIVRAFFNLTHNPDSYMILREDKDDPATETRIPLPAGAQVVLDTQRLYHAVWHPGRAPRYCLITSYESGPALDSWMSQRHPINQFQSEALDSQFAQAAYETADARRAARAASLAAQGSDPRFGDGTLASMEEQTSGMSMETLSEA